MTNIEHRSLFQLLQNLRPRDAEGLGKRRPDCMLRPTCDRVTSQKAMYYRPTTAVRTLGGVSDCATNCCTLQHASKRDIVLICLLGACLLVTSVSLVASCKKWTCPPDNHAWTFDMTGDILTCLGHTDWHYFEPCQYVTSYGYTLQKKINKIMLFTCDLPVRPSFRLSDGHERQEVVSNF